MTGFQAVKLVAFRELRERGRSKAYIISTIFTVLILAGGILLPTLLGSDFTTYEVGIVGDDSLAIVDMATEIAAQRAGDDPADQFEVTDFATTDGAETALDEGDVEAVLIDGTELIAGGTNAFGGSSVGSMLQEAASTLRIQDLVSSSDQAADVVALLGSEPLEVRHISGEGEADEALRGAIAFGGLVLMYVAVLTYGTWMLSGVTEEKTNRVVEVLLSTLRPWHIFAGKLAGIGLLGIGQMLIVIGVALVALRLGGTLDIPSLPIDSVIALIGWFILGFLLYATLFGAAGSLVSRMEDAQNAAAPLSILAVVGYFFSFTALGNPDGTVAVIGTFVPFTAPYVAPIRLAFGAIGGFEMALAVLVTGLAIILMVRLAGRVYAGGLLRFGSRVKWREALRSGD